jgi:cyclohexyl-isocyanide hydratase
MLIGFVLYPEVTALDAVGPFEVLARVPGASVCFVGAQRGLVPAQYGLGLSADASWDDCPPLDALCVPGGPGQVTAMEDAPLLQFLRRQGESAAWVTAVCTGSLLLGAAGLLRGYRATTHWRYMDCLADLGALPVRKRVVADRNRITGAGVSAGIDMGLFLAALLAGEGAAQAIQLQIEYDPQPPFRSGSPERADRELVEQMEEATAALYERRREQCRRLSLSNRPETISTP